MIRRTFAVFAASAVGLLVLLAPDTAVVFLAGAAFLAAILVLVLAGSSTLTWFARR